MLDFPFALGSSASVSAALWMTVASIGASLLLLLYTLELRLRRRLRERRRANVIAHWRTVIADAVTGAEVPATQKLRRNERQEFLRLWVYTRSMVEGAAADRLIALARHLELPALARRQASNVHVGVRLMALQAQGYLRDPADFADLAAATDDANALVSVTAAEALVAIDANRAVARLIPKLSSRRDWPRTHVFKVLQRAGSAVIGEPLYRHIRAASDEDAAYLLQFVEIAEFDVRDALAVELLRSRTNAEVLAAALKVATGHEPVPRIDELLAHPAWYVRMQAARFLGRMARKEDAGRLEALLADKEWWVRYRAAKALVGLPSMTAPELERIRLRLHDHYARDILGQALAEAGAR